MGIIGDDILDMLNADIFKQILQNDALTIAQFNTVTALMIRKRIPFDTKYTNGTRRDDPTLEITIYINPNTTLTYSFTSQQSSPVFTQ